MPNPDLLDIDKGLVTAPAGCGKTHLIAETLLKHDDAKPILVLTHTNAGVAALRSRLDRIGVQRSSYRLATIDGWSMRVVGTYPTGCRVNSNILHLTNPRRDYPAIRIGIHNLMTDHHIDDVLGATYARLIVDEYQDCTLAQHQIIQHLSQILPTCLLGDPLQAIFGWAGNEPPSWRDVVAEFPIAGELDTPWRWINAGHEAFGRWLLGVRKLIVAGEVIDLRDSPEEVQRIHLDGRDDHNLKVRAAHVRPPNEGGTVLLIANSMPRANHWRYASQIKGAIVVENADLGEFTEFAAGFDINANDAIEKLVEFSGKVMTNVGAGDMIRRIRTIQENRARKAPSDAELAALTFVKKPTPENAVEVLVEIGRQPGVRAHRAALLRACIRAFNSCIDETDFYDSAVRIREQSRVLGRAVAKRSVGSTLLLKGLEADVSVILDTEQLSPKDLYVAMTRGARKLVICSSTPILRTR